MKIGFFLPNATFDLPGSPEVGGIETFAFAVGEALQRLGHDVVLFGGKPKFGRTHRPTTMRLELFDYIETKSIPDIGTRFQRLVQRLHFGRKTYRALLAENLDVVLTFKPFDWPVARWWKRRQPGLKVIMSFGGTDWFFSDRLFYGAVDHAFAVSPMVVDLAVEHLHCRPPALIPNPADLTVFAPDSSAPAPDTTGPFRLAASGRLVGWKGFLNLVEAVGLLKSEGLDVTVDLAGEGEERARLEARIAELGLADRFRLHGALDQHTLGGLLRRAEAYVAPSTGLEAFSIAACEAGAVGLPLLLSDQVGLRLFLSGRDFRDYPAKDVRQLAVGIRELAARRHDAAWTDRPARHERFRQRFAPEVVAGQVLALLEENS